MEDEKKGIFSKLMDYLAVPGNMTRAGIGAVQNDQPVYDAIKAQATPNPQTKAPSGYDIASKFGEQHDVQNPYALAALATAADVVDPTMLIPETKILGAAAPLAGLVKGAHLMEEAGPVAKAMYRAGDFVFPAAHEAEAMQVVKALKQQGKLPGTVTLVKDTKPAMKAGKVLGFKEEGPQTLKEFNNVKGLLSKSQLK